MKALYLKRRGGKTTKAIRICLKTGATLVVCNYTMKNMLALDPRYAGLKIATHHHLICGLLRGVERIVIDDTDMLLRSLAGSTKIDCVTISKNLTKAEKKLYGLPENYHGS